MFQPPCSVTFSTKERKKERKERNQISETRRKGGGQEGKGRKTGKHKRTRRRNEG
jgi:hypothetical protein